MNKDNTFIGVLLVVVGCLIFAAKYMFGIELFHFHSGDFWPIIVLSVGLIFELVFFTTRKAVGLLVPGGIITVCGLLFFFEVATNWKFSAYTWPVYIFAVAFGLFQLYLFGGKHRGLLIPVFILSTVGGIAAISILFEGIVTWFDFSLVVPVLLILLGLFIVFGRKKNKTF